MIDRYSRPAMKWVWSEENKYNLWLKVELAVCEAWAQEGVVPPEDMAKLREAKYNHNRMMEILDTVRHETNAFLTSVTEGLGPEGRWLHLGLTSSDKLDRRCAAGRHGQAVQPQHDGNSLDTDTGSPTCGSLQLVEAGNLLLQDMDQAIAAIEKQAVKHKDTIMMGRTHGVHAEPITFGLKMALWWEEMRRQRARLVDALETVRVGKISGAVGTHATVPPSVEDKVCEQLGLEVAAVSNQVVQRDRYAHFILTLALIAASLEKFATEIRSLQRTEIHELEEPFDEGQKGSSSMPHKRNPELAERICGLARLIRGHSVTALENVALWGERDISHSSAERIILPDACLALDYILSIFTRVMADLRVYPQRMWDNIESTQGLIFSQRVLLALIDKGMAREAAYQIVQRNAMSGWDDGKDFRQLIEADKDAEVYLSETELRELFDYSYYTRYVDDTFERLGLLVAKAAV